MRLSVFSAVMFVTVKRNKQHKQIFTGASRNGVFRFVNKNSFGLD
ncbi:hypothetical protein LV85_00226 [Algoriphagus chordae]|uniref:Uncharacterized protein n=1 Tax=Algoriphagus chordae TaxID=237019 RepID=A0A2W7RI47_9BACT|nr:hypothetical protein LV85_00226 [Algoriphagus chordae]